MKISFKGKLYLSTLDSNVIPLNLFICSQESTSKHLELKSVFRSKI